MKNEEIARKAAHWWAEKYKYPKFDNGDRSSSGAMGMMLAMMLTKDITPEVAQKFEDELYDRILNMLNDGTNRGIAIDVDYNPCRILSEACEASGMSVHNSPWKTNMNIYKGCISVSEGYGAPFLDI